MTGTMSDEKKIGENAINPQPKGIVLSPGSEASLEFRASRATAEWISTLYPWDLFICLTFDVDLRPRKAMLTFTEFAQQLARRQLKLHVAMAWFFGLQENDRPHFHLLAGTLAGEQRRLNPLDIEIAWTDCRRQEHGRDVCGRFEAELVEGKGAAHYGKKHEIWEIPNVACPRLAACRRPRKGCIEARAPWPPPGSLHT